MYSSVAQQPLYEIKADLFKALAHPVRIRVLELLAQTPERSVSELLQETSLEASHLSQHLAVLRRFRVVHSQRRANAVFYRLASDQIVPLLTSARVFLQENLASASLSLDAAEALPGLEQ